MAAGMQPVTAMLLFIMSSTKHLVAGLGGQVFGDRSYISPALHDLLLGQGLELLTTIRKNMQNRMMRLWDTLFLR
jgi:hypothetical protein